MGPNHYFLGVEVDRDSSVLSKTQGKYAAHLLFSLNLASFNSAATPLASHANLSAGQTSDPYYRQLVGSPKYYLTFKNPDISDAVNLLSKILHAPREPNLQAAKCILRYI